MDEKHFKRIGTLIAALAVKQDGDLHHAVHIDPAVLIKCRKPKVVSNPKNLLVCTNETGVINGVYMRDKFVPYLSNCRRLGAKLLSSWILLVHTLRHLFWQLSAMLD